MIKHNQERLVLTSSIVIFMILGLILSANVASAGGPSRESPQTFYWYTKNVSAGPVSQGEGEGPATYTNIWSLYSCLDTTSPSGETMAVGYIVSGTFTYSYVSAGGCGPTWSESPSGAGSAADGYGNPNSVSVSITGTDHYEICVSPCPMASGP